VYESLKGTSSSAQQQQPPVFLSISQKIEAPAGSGSVLPVCLWPQEVSRALEIGINTAFAGQLSQNASVDTTYIQVGASLHLFAHVRMGKWVGFWVGQQLLLLFAEHHACS
jgi:hypothetical protein